MADYLARALFRIKWTFMSPRRQYAYLWNRTRESYYNYAPR